MGDDLMAAQRFINLCDDHVQSLIKGQVTNNKSRLELIEQIKQEAETSKARAIYRMADQFAQDLTFDPSGRRSAGSLLALNKLVCQYRIGLEDISIKGPEVRSVEINQLFNQAVSTLNPLIQLADPGQQSALKRLTLWQMPPHPEDIPRYFHDFMPDLTDELLRLARQQEKSVSVSFSADKQPMSADVYASVKQAILFIGRELICQTIEIPAKRSAKGLSRSGHIAITARQDKSVMHVLLTCKGRLPAKAWLNDKTMSALSNFGARSGFDRQDDLISVALADIQYKTAMSEPSYDTLYPVREAQL